MLLSGNDGVDAKRPFLDQRNKEIRESNKEIDVILFGDSITEHFNFTFYDTVNCKYINSALSGDRTDFMRKRLAEDVISLSPRKVIMMAGINDITYNLYLNKEIDQIIKQLIDNITAMVEEMQMNGIQVVLCSILPIDIELSNNSVVAVNSYVDNVNKLLQQLCVDKDIDFINYFEDFITESWTMNKALAPDGVHPNHYGYKKMFKKISKHL